MRSKINKSSDIVFEQIPYDQFYDIKEIGKDGSDTLYVATWKDGPLQYKMTWSREPDKEVVLKWLCDSSQDMTKLRKVNF